MKLVTIDSREVAGRPGILLDDGEILDLAAAPHTLAEAQWVPPSVVSILEAGDHGREHIDEILLNLAKAPATHLQTLRDTGVLLPASATALLPPVRRPGLILVNAGAKSAATGRAERFIKSPNTAVGQDALVAVPWQGEVGISGSCLLGIVLGKSVYRADRHAVELAIAGLTALINLSTPMPDADASLTDWQRFVESNQFPGACPMGPAIITCDELDEPCEVSVIIRINGVEVGKGPLTDRSYNLTEAVVRLSRLFAFRPGDIVAFPSGAPAVMLRSNDRLAVEWAGRMELRVTVTF